MAKKEYERAKDSINTKEFIKKNWPVAALVAGAGVVGAAIWLTARYMREKKKLKIEQERNLKQIEKEIEDQTDPTVALLEIGAYLGQIGGDDTIAATEELERNIDHPEAKESLEVLREIAKIQEKDRTRQTNHK